MNRNNDSKIKGRMVKTTAALLALALLTSCQTTSISNDTRLSFYSERISKHCVLVTPSMKLGTSKIYDISISSIRDGSVDGRRGWVSVTFYTKGLGGNYYHDTIKDKSYCGLDFINMGYVFRPDT
jgi:hypothetical protein